MPIKGIEMDFKKLTLFKITHDYARQVLTDTLIILIALPKIEP